MSEEAKLVYIDMRLKEIRWTRRVMNYGIWVGVILMFIGSVLGDLGFWLMVVGIVIASFEFYSYALDSYRYFRLKQEWRTLEQKNK